MAQDIVYTLGIIIAIFLLLLFLRSVFIHRARIAQQSAFSALTPAINPNAATVTAPGVTNYQHARSDVTRPPAAAMLATSERDRERDEECLPRYEAPPPKYDSIVKGTGGVEMTGVSRVSRVSRGESEGSGSAAGRSGGLDSSPAGGGGDVVVVVEDPGVRRATTTTATESTESRGRVEKGRAWVRGVFAG